MQPRDATPYHVEYVIGLTGKAAPRLCVLNQAVGDDPAIYLRIHDRLASSSAEVRHLSLFPMPNVADPEDFLLSQDIIFVGGGSVANMVAIWKVHGLDQILRKAWHAGIVLAGGSAGALCWFESGTTDSFGAKLRPWYDGLGLLAGSYCPHYHSEPERRPLYRRLVADGTLPAGHACDDGAGAHYVDDTLAEMIADHPDGKAYRVTPDGAGGAIEEPLPVRFLGDLLPDRGHPVQGPGERGERDDRQQPPGVDACGVHQDLGEDQAGHDEGGDVPVVADDEVVPECAE
jgi:peptidase E